MLLLDTGRSKQDATSSQDATWASETLERRSRFEMLYRGLLTAAADRRADRRAVAGTSAIVASPLAEPALGVGDHLFRTHQRFAIASS